MKKFTLYFHSLGFDKDTRIDFQSKEAAVDVIEFAKLAHYKMYQYIESDFTHYMSKDELKLKNIRFNEIHKEVKKWFGLLKINKTDLLIEPQIGFYYPYHYGIYLYLFTKKTILHTDFKKWLDRNFSSGLEEIDPTSSLKISLMNEDDFLVVTNHDCQEELYVIGKNRVVEKIISKFSNFYFKNELKIQSYRIN